MNLPPLTRSAAEPRWAGIAVALAALLGVSVAGYAQELPASGTPYAETPAEPGAGAPHDAVFEDWEEQATGTSDFVWRSAGGALWSADAGPSRLELRLDGWSQQVADDPFCLNAGFTGCHDAIGGSLSLQARLELARSLELRLQLGASAASSVVAATAGATLVWWFSDDLGLALGVTYLQPLAVPTHDDAIPAMLDFERAFVHESPYDLPDPRWSGQWMGGLGLVSRSD